MAVRKQAALNASGFAEQVWEAARQIPKGKVLTYAGLARLIGRPQAARAVGNALNKNPHWPHVPCHRIVRADGRIGGFASGPARKKALLRSEGVTIIKDAVRPLARFLYKKQ